MLKSFFLSLLLSVSVVGFSTGLTVKISVPPSQLYLGVYYGAGVAVIDSFLCSGDEVSWHVDKRLDEGIYFLSDGPAGHRFDFLIGDDQSVSIGLHSLGSGEVQMSGSVESVVFNDYQSYVSDRSRSKDEKFAYTQSAYEKADQGTFLKLVLGALLPSPSRAFSPSMLVVDDGGVNDYNVSHFWDNYDLSDERLVRTPFFAPRVESFLRQVLEPREDKIRPAVLDLLEKVDANDPLIKLVVSKALKLSNENQIMGIDALSYDLVTRYYLSGRFGVLPEKQQLMLEDFVLHTKNCRVGHIAKELRIDAFDRDLGEVSLFEQKSQYTLVVFWEPNCDYCSKVLPALRDDIYRIYNQKGLSIFAVNTQSDYVSWRQFVFDNELMEWTHGYSASGESGFMIDYGVQGTPYMYILDKDKRIVAKNVKLDFLIPMLDRLFATGSIY